MTITEFLEARIAEDERRASYYGLALGTARVLAECAAKRAIISEHGCGDSYVSDWCETCAQWWASEVGEGPPGVAWPCLTLKALAAVYAGHPDYQQEWALAHS